MTTTATKFSIVSYKKADDLERAGCPRTEYSMEAAEKVARKQRLTHARVYILGDHDDLGGQPILQVL